MLSCDSDLLSMLSCYLSNWINDQVCNIRSIEHAQLRRSFFTFVWSSITELVKYSWEANFDINVGHLLQFL